MLGADHVIVFRGGRKMAGKKVGTLIKEARTQAGMTQEALAKKVKGVSASDISFAERGEKELTQAALKEIAKVTGVTQKSLLDAAKGTSGSVEKTTSGSTKKTTTGSAKKTTSGSTKKKTTGSAKKTTSGSAKKTSSGSAKKTGTDTTFKLSAEEKKLIQAYREADEKQKAAVKMLLLKTDGITSAAGLAGHTAGAFGELLGSGDLLSSLVGSVKDLLS